MKLRFFGLAGMLLIATTVAVSGPVPTPPDMNVVATNSFNTLVLDIQKNNPAVLAAEAALDAAQANLDAADRPLYNPSLELDAENTDIKTTTLGISQTIDWADKRQARYRLAETELLAAEAELALVRRELAVEVLTSLAQYQMMFKQRELAVRRSQLMQAFADTAKQRLLAGDVSQLDIALARVAYTEARMQQGSAEANLISFDAALRAVSGEKKSLWPSLPGALPQLVAKMDLQALISRLPEIIIQQSQYDNAKARIDVSKRERRADPTIAIRGGREDDENLFGLSLEIPLFIRNSFRAEVRAASQEALQAEQVLIESRRRSLARLEGAIASYRIAAATWESWLGTGQSSLNEQVNLLEKLWQAGELNATDYLIQSRQNVEIQSTAAELTGQVWLAAIEWLAASGTIDEWLKQAK